MRLPLVLNQPSIQIYVMPCLYFSFSSLFLYLSFCKTTATRLSVEKRFTGVGGFLLGKIFLNDLVLLTASVNVS